MNEQKQKIISDICPFYKEYGTCEQCNKDLDIDDEPCYFECMANAIINNKYVKQIEGEWIRHRENCLYNKCSVCEYEHCREDNFCPNCGAHMRKEDEGK